MCSDIQGIIALFIVPSNGLTGLSRVVAPVTSNYCVA